MSWKRLIIPSSVLLTTLLLAGMLQSQVAANLHQANLRVIREPGGSSDRPIPALRLGQRSPAPRPAFSIRSLDIGGISTGSSEAQVRQRLGTPQRVQNQFWECCGTVRTLHYPATQVELIEGEAPGAFTVFSVSTTRSDLPTRAGVRVGDLQQKVIATYGSASGTRSEAGTTTLFYTLDEYAAALWFRVRNGRVIELGFDEQLT